MGQRRVVSLLVGTHRDHIEYFETYAPTLSKTSLRPFLSEVVQRGWCLRHWDVETAFLNSALTEEAFMSQPERYADGSPKVLRLLKIIYGLKQSPSCWYLTLKDSIEQFGLKSTEFTIFRS
jgi:hypothetical protein